MRLINHSETLKLLEIIRSELDQEQDLFLVGGAVRDAYLGNKSKDLDFTLSENPTILIKKLAKRLGAGYFILDDDRHTARLNFHTRNGDPFSLDFAQFTGEDLDSDLKNRDFTINAMAVSIDDPHTLIDPLDGKVDLKAGLLRSCSSHSLLDDPLRVLRGIRLTYQFGFNYSSSLIEQMLLAADRLSDISFERQRDELFKILDGPNPTPALKDCYKFKVINTLIPPLLEQADIPPSPPHVFSLFEHTLKAVERCDQLLGTIMTGEFEDKPEFWWLDEVVSCFEPYSDGVRAYFEEEITPGRSIYSLTLLGALIHDIGKPSTMTEGGDGRLHYYAHERVGAEMAWDLGKRMMLSNAESDWLRKLVLNHLRLVPIMRSEGLPSKRDVFRFFTHTEGAGIAVVMLSLADTFATNDRTLSKNKWKHEVAVSKVFLNAWWEQQGTVIAPTPLLNGDDLQRLFGLPPGKNIGKLLKMLTETQACGEVSTQNEAILFVQDHLDNIQQSKKH